MPPCTHDRDHVAGPAHDPRGTADTDLGHATVVAEESGWVVLGHREARSVAEDATRFSSHVSSHLQVPNGLDGAEHAAYRSVVDSFFTADRMAALEPALTAVAQDLVAHLIPDSPADAVADIGSVFAVRAQTTWLGWPATLEPRLLAWMRDNHRATRSGDRDRTDAVARAFDDLIEEALRSRSSFGEVPTVTDELLERCVCVDGVEPRRLTRAEVVSILRNWTGGDLGSIALCVGVILEALAGDRQLQERAREADRAQLTSLIDELLRRDDPFVSSRRVALCPVDLAGHHLAAGDPVRINWTAANRDPRVFADPDRLDPAHASDNLVYGVGPHVCPGRPLATVELCILTEALLSRFTLAPSCAVSTTRELNPLGGFASVGITMKDRGLRLGAPGAS